MGYSEELIRDIKSADWGDINEIDVLNIVDCVERGSPDLLGRISNTFRASISIHEANADHGKLMVQRYIHREKLYRKCFSEIQSKRL